jgi:hypothetical protein
MTLGIWVSRLTGKDVHLCAEFKTVITALLKVKSGLDPYGINENDCRKMIDDVFICYFTTHVTSFM